MPTHDFEFDRKPFSAGFEPSRYAALPGHDEALQGLLHWCLESDGVGLLTAASGMGKSYLCQLLAEKLPAEFETILLPHSNYPTQRELYQTILSQMGETYSNEEETELRREVDEQFAKIASEKKQILLIIDEAHELSEQRMHGLRAFISLQEKPILLLLSGQLELEEILTRRTLSSLNQRVRTHQILETLTRNESSEYLASRFEWAGRDIEELLEEEALALMVHVSDGVPRCLDQIAETSLRVASEAGYEIVSEESVRRAFEKVRHLPLSWRELPGADPIESDGESATSSAESDAHREADRQPVPDLKEEADQAGVDYVVAEFGSGIDEKVEELDVPESDDDDLFDPNADTQLLPTGTPEPQNPQVNPQEEFDSGPEFPDNLMQEFSTLEEFPAFGSKEDDEHLQGSVEEMIEMIASESEPVAAQTAKMVSETNSPPADRLMRPSRNPVALFAADIPSEIPAPHHQPQGFDAELEEVEREINHLRQEARAWKPAPDEPLNPYQYDVIEPEMIPSVPRVRPGVELNLPYLEAKPRYKNLFRNLRRRRGES